jgi:predicted aminopeptidase
LLSAFLLLTGCAPLAYYLQAAGGQMEVSGKAVPITDVLADPATDPELARRLAVVLAAREFASRELKLPDNDSFRRYADLGRRYAVWNVFAAPEFSLKPLEWCFPVAGCVAYRGYFSEAAAQAAAAELTAAGFDVFVAGIPTYSTLGWFADPVLNTFIRYPEGELVGLIFHELAHQTVYLPGDTAFNESFATAVEEAGVRRWFAQQPDSPPARAWEETRQRRQDFHALLFRIRDQLARAFAEAADEADARARKAAILRAAAAEYEGLRASWGGYSGYDHWFRSSPLNTAKLASATLYLDHLPAFRTLLGCLDGDLPAFYEAARGLAKLPAPKRNSLLAGLAGGERCVVLTPSGATPIMGGMTSSLSSTP